MNNSALVSVKNGAFWCTAGLCFMVFSFVGHWLEISASTVLWLATGQGFDAHITSDFTEPYLIYGAGAVFCAFVLRPSYLQFRLNPVSLYLVCSFTCAIIEYAAAQIMVLMWGSNPFWDYSDSLLNLNGQVCLFNTSLFGAAATAFIIFACPRIEDWLTRLSMRQLGSYTAQVAALFVLGFVAPWQFLVGYLLVVVTLPILRHGFNHSVAVSQLVGSGFEIMVRRPHPSQQTHDRGSLRITLDSPLGVARKA